MFTVWKFGLRPGVNEIEMPEGATPLHLAMQGGVPTLWAHCRVEANKVKQRIALIGTGEAAPDLTVPAEAIYVGSLQMTSFLGRMLEQEIVLHCFWKRGA